MGSFHVPRPVVGLRLLIAVSSLASGCTGPHSHEHEEEAEVPMESVTLASGSLELFMEHPYLVRGEGAKFNVHLTVLKDGMPIRSGTLTVTARGPTGKTATVVQDAPKRPGIFGPVVPFPEPGENEMSLSLESEQATETIRVPVTVYADGGAAKKAADEAKEEEADGAITFLKEQAWKIGVVHEPVTSRRLVERLSAPGELLPAAGAKAVVTSPMPGRLLPPPSGPLPARRRDGRGRASPRPGRAADGRSRRGGDARRPGPGPGRPGRPRREAQGGRDRHPEGQGRPRPRQHHARPGEDAGQQERPPEEGRR